MEKWINLRRKSTVPVIAVGLDVEAEGFSQNAIQASDILLRCSGHEKSPLMKLANSVYRQFYDIIGVADPKGPPVY